MSLADKRIWRNGTRHLRKNDKTLARAIDKVGPFKFELEDGYYKSLVGAIIFQQLAGKAAQAILNRFKQLYNGKVPSPEEYLRTDESKLRSAGLSPQKISYIRDLCQRIEKGELDLKGLRDLPDDEVVSRLDAVRGVGRWTAEMFLIFVLGRTDVLPVDDLGLRKAAKRVYGLRKLPSRERFETLASNWHPYCSIATLFLWRTREEPGDPVKW
ncbi:MAG TPA: DNA-3-methyladenine glycosylase 2 family protein [Candidatus Bathyarchaeia archaeon]